MQALSTAQQPLLARVAKQWDAGRSEEGQVYRKASPLRFWEGVGGLRTYAPSVWPRIL